MITMEDRLRKAEHDAWLANLAASKNAANVDYIAMMSDIDIPVAEEEEINE